ncbi:MAG: RDD family protein [Candidatus Methanofastidiosia archaeon]|jgi:uncharacterized RDD family membrane protein YckC
MATQSEKIMCSNCGTENMSGTTSCKNCGHSLLSEQERLPYARILRRFIAFLIDDLLVSIAVFAVLWAAVTYNWGILEFFLIVYLFRWVYFAGFQSSQYQATLGKMICGIVVTDEQGNRISFITATIRVFSKILSQILLFGGYFMAVFTEKRQGLHDKIAGTVVLKKTRKEKKHPLYQGLE